MLKSGLAAVVVLVMVGSLFVVPYGDVAAEDGAADDYGYKWVDSNPGTSTVAFDWVEISTTGTDTYAQGDDSYGGPLDIGFDFEFYGNTYSQFYVTTNGYLSFSGGSSYYSNGVIPSTSGPNDFIAAYWDDLCVDYSGYNSGTIFYETVGVSPNQQLVVEFHEISHLSYYDLMTFEILLNETGEIWMQYHTMSGMTGGSATVGIENADGTIGLEYSYGENRLSDGLAIRFSMTEVGFGPGQDGLGDAGDWVDYAVTVTNRQDIADTFDISNTSDLGWTIEVLDVLLSPLGDSNGDLLPDTGAVPAQSTFDLVVRVHIPLIPAERLETSVLSATSYADPSNNASVTLSTAAIGATLTPPYDEYVPDYDADSQHDFLGVNVTFDALFSDDYLVSVYVYGPGYAYITYLSVSVVAGPGPCVAYVEVPGNELFLSGLDGPYILDLILYDGNGSDVSSDTHITSAYLYTDFEMPAVLFTPPHDDSGLDLNADVLYDYLVVNVSVEISEEGSYEFYADLYGTFGTFIASDHNATGTLTVGTHTIEFRLSGMDLHESGINGPYDVYIYAYDSTFDYIGGDVHETGAYVWSQFQYPVTLAPPYTDYGIDTDLDTFYDQLAVEVPVEVFFEDDYTIEVYLYDSGWDDIGWFSDTTTLSEGGHTFVAEFDGSAIYDNGVDGPFNVEIYLYSDYFGFVDYDSYLTSGYTCDEFEQPPIGLWPPYSDFAIDSDGDLLYDLLVVEVQVYVDVAGNYILYANLYDSGWSYVTWTMNETHFEVGLHTVLLEFDGTAIRGQGVSDSFNVQLDAYDENWTYYDSDGYVTAYYAAEDFEAAVLLDPPHSDHGEDSNDNLLYDWLVVEVVLDVEISGLYYVYGSLYEVMYLDDDDATVTLDAGTNVVELQFDGRTISDEMVDGPYTVYLTVNDASWATVATGEHVTHSYAWEEFERDGASFAPPYSDYAVDVNSDMLYDYLVVEVYVDVVIAGEYELDAYLFTPSWDNVANEDIYVEFATGTNTFEVYFPGVLVWESAASGAFEVGFDLYDPTGTYLDTDWYTTASYAWDDFSPPSGELWPPHSDYGMDTDGDMLFNYLVVEVSVDVAIAGYFEVEGELYDTWGFWVASSSNWTYLETDIQTVDLYFAGWNMRASGEDGPYDVWLGLYDFAGVEVDSGWHTTDYYAWDEFQTSPAWLAPPYNDHGLDTGADSLFDYLVIEVPVEVALEEDYSVFVDVYSSSWSWICYAETDIHLDVGTHTVEVLVDGWDLGGSGEDGPYEVEVNLDDWYGNLIDYDYYTTDTYSADEFQTFPGQFDGPHSDYCIDSDGDDLYDLLVVEANLDIAVGGSFIVYALLYDGLGNTIDFDIIEVDLGVGIQTVELSFDGWRVYASGASGPYDVEMYLYTEDESLLDYDDHTTDAYPLVDFETEVPSMRSYWTDSPPTIDGEFSEGEWAEAVAVDLVLADPDNVLPSLILVMNNGTHLFICYDALGDLSEDESDAASVAFDTGNDGVMTDGAEDQFVVGGTDWLADGEAHYVYSSALVDWVLHCSPFDDLLADHAALDGAMGFGSSDNLASDHRVYEICIPLDLLGAAAGDVLGFLGGSNECPGVVDGGDFNYSTWPSFLLDIPDLVYYGDLVLYSSNPPSTEVSLDGTLGGNGWYLSTVVATLTSEDADEGVDYTTYRLDGGEWLVYSTPVSVSGGRVHTLEYYSVDLGGNAEATHACTISIDLTVPTTTPVPSGTEGENEWYTSEVSVLLSASDNTGGSGIDFTMYRIGTGAWTEYSGAAITFSESGSWAIEFYSVDLASHAESAKSLTIMIDLQMPVTVSSVSGSTVALTSTDGESGVDATFFRVDGGNWIAYSGEFVVEGSGNHTVEYYSVDVAGNTEAVKTLYVEVPAAGMFGQIGELWIVLLIIALMAVIAVPVIFGMRRKAQMADSRAVMKDAVSPVAQLLDEQNPWPADAKPENMPPVEGEDLPPPK